MNQTLINWLETNLVERNTVNYKFDTSQIRVTFEYETKMYVSNDEVNKAMLQLGFRPANYKNNPYLVFNVSSQSPALRKYHHKVLGPH